MDMDIQKVARLARLALDPEEAEALAAELTSILTYVDQLDQVDTSEVPPTHHVVSVQTPYREDVKGEHGPPLWERHKKPSRQNPGPRNPTGAARASPTGLTSSSE